MFEFVSVPSSHDNVAALATGDGLVQTWSLWPEHRQAAFQTVFGGALGRLAVGTAMDRSVVVTAAFHHGRIVGYDAETGDVLWERADVRPVWNLAVAGEDRLVGAAFDRGPMQILEVSTGHTLSSVSGPMALHAGPMTDIAVAAFDGRCALVRVNPWQHVARLKLPGFGVLDAEFTSDAALVSMVQDPEEGPSAVYRLTLSGETVWRYESRDGCNVLRVGCDRQSDEWLGVEHDPNQRQPPTLLRWTQGGDVVSRQPLPSAVDFAFALEGSAIVATPGILIDTRSLSTIDLIA